MSTTEERYSATRQITPPRRVWVDPRRIWVAPVREPERVMPVTLGEKAASIELRMNEDWIPALAYRWVRLYFLIQPVWFLEIELEMRTRNELVVVGLRQWVPWDAVQPPPPNAPNGPGSRQGR